MAMNVNELADLLEDLKAQGHGEKSVMFAYNYGDYWRTTVAAGVDAVEVEQVKHSEYHQMHKVLSVNDDGELPEGGIEVVLLS